MIIEAREDTVTLTGAVTLNMWPAVQAAAAMLLKNHPTGIIIDCSGLTQCTQKGAETFADAFEYIGAHNARIVVAGLSQDFLEIGKAVPGVRSQLPTAATLEQARASLQLEEIEPKKGKARMKAVMPISGNWRRALYHVQKLAAGEDCEIHLVDLLRVPRALPIGTPLPERESEGSDRLDEAEQAAQNAGLSIFKHVERVRWRAAGLADFANRLGATFTVASLDPQHDDREPAPPFTEPLSLVEAINAEISLVKGSGGLRGEEHWHEILVPAVGEWQHALEHACKLAKGWKAEQSAQVSLVYFISVPRRDPLDASMPDAESAASDCERRAARIAAKHRVHVTTLVERVREPIWHLLNMLQDGRYQLAVVGMARGDIEHSHAARETADALFHEPPCEIVLLRIA